MSICEISACTSVVIARKMCSKHYRRWHTYGDPHKLHPRRITDHEDQRIIDMRQQRMSTYEIARAIGKSRNTICSRIQILKRDGRLPPLHSPERSARNIILAGYQHDAYEHGRRWLLTTEEFHSLIVQACNYCGQPPSNHRSRYPDFVYTGIDRVKNDGDYEMTNVVPCCATCNYAKRFMDEAEFLNWVRRVYCHAC